LPGLLLHLGAEVACSHGAPATPTAPNMRVRVMGMPVSMAPIPYLVAGCPFTPPCVSAQFMNPALRVTSNGIPLLLNDSIGTCEPTLTALIVAFTQTRVLAI